MTSKPPQSKKRKSVPTSINSFTVLPLTLPPQPGLPEAYNDAKHYLYIKTHTPSQPTPSTDRSLFVANVPIDASESSLRTLFAEQLGGSRVSHVEFESNIPTAPVHKRRKEADEEAEQAESRGKKRKREREEEAVAEGVVEDEESALPRIWNGELRASGSAAVVVFVDKGSAKGALREVQKAAGARREVLWRGDAGVGVERKCSGATALRLWVEWLRVLTMWTQAIDRTCRCAILPRRSSSHPSTPTSPGSTASRPCAIACVRTRVPSLTKKASSW